MDLNRQVGVQEEWEQGEVLGSDYNTSRQPSNQEGFFY